MHACDRQTDGRTQTDGQTEFSSLDRVCIACSAVKTIYSGISKCNFKDHYGDAVIKQCLGKIAEINEFSAFDEMS